MTFEQAFKMLLYGGSPMEPNNRACYLRMSYYQSMSSRFMLVKSDEHNQPVYADCVMSTVKQLESDAEWLSHRPYYSARDIFPALTLSDHKLLMTSSEWIVGDFMEIARRIRSGL
jgi:hypothetical protein